MSALQHAQPGPLRARSRGTLVSRLRAGDADALGELFDSCGSKALALAMHLGHDRARADDLVHDAFVTVWRDIHGYQGHDPALPGWVLSIVRATAAERGSPGPRSDP